LWGWRNALTNQRDYVLKLSARKHSTQTSKAHAQRALG